MTNWLVKHFVKDYENIESDSVRGRYGTLSSLVGIFCNVLLFIAKFVIGFLSNSIAITSDAFNNLSDCASCVVTLFGYKLAAKPADKDHPFGHGRIEYLTSLIISVVILIVGYELFKSSFDKLIHPEEVQFSFVALFVLIISILIKLWMSFFNRKLGKKINSSVMAATAADSLSDVIATSATLISLTASLFTDLPIDGAMGILVSLFIFYSGFGLIKDTLNQLIGQTADPDMIEKIKALILKSDQVIGIHDMIIHNYGPGKMLGSAHVEVCSSSDILAAHDAIDQIEKEIQSALHIMMTLHMDPVETEDETVKQCRETAEKIVAETVEGMSLHDFRIISGPTHTNLIFDVAVPYGCKLSDDELKNKIDSEMQKHDPSWFTVIVFDRSYIA